MVWDEAGYPEWPHPAALRGDVVHGALEEVVDALTAGGVESGASAAAVDVLRGLGGYSGVIERSIDSQTAQLEANPRLAKRLDSLVRDLRNKIPEMRQKAQAALSRTRFVPRGSGTGPSGATPATLGPGSYSEFQVVSTALGWSGRVDLLTVDGGDIHILDYKTGEPSEHHVDQVRTYALLWFRRDGGDDAPPMATRLTLSYPTHDVDVPAPSEQELRDLERDLMERTEEARSQLKEDKPARPAPDVCAYCSVRHLCEDYWRALTPAGEGPTDASLTILARNGPRSFRAELEQAKEEILIRTSEQAEMPTGSRWRLLNGFGVRTDEDELTISVGAASEQYRLRDT